VGSAQRTARIEVERARRFGIMHSALLGRIVLSRLADARERWSRAQEGFLDRSLENRRESHNRAFVSPSTEAGTLEEAVDCWYESSLAMHHLCAPQGTRYVHALQPTLRDEGSKPLTDEEKRKGLVDGEFAERVKQGYPLLREALARLVAAGVDAHDLSDTFKGIEETLYYDSAHFNQTGNRLVAERLLEGILARL
jgi:hypothetical protein